MKRPPRGPLHLGGEAQPTPITWPVIASPEMAEDDCSVSDSLSPNWVFEAPGPTADSPVKEPSVFAEVASPDSALRPSPSLEATMSASPPAEPMTWPDAASPLLASESWPSSEELSPSWKFDAPGPVADWPVKLELPFEEVASPDSA